MAFADLVAAADRAAQNHLGGVDVTYTPAAGDPVTVRAILDQASLGLPDLSGPAIFVRLEDLPETPTCDDAIVTIDETQYRIRAVEPEVMSSGLGGIRLWLVEMP